MSMRVIHIGNVAVPKKETVCVLKNYAQFYNELVERGQTVSVFAGYLTSGETGYEFLNETALSSQINLCLAKGNTPNTAFRKFLRNNIRLLARLTRFCLRKDHYFIFLPSPLGVWALLVVALLRRKKSLGIYIGGYFGREQAFEQRAGSLKKQIKKRMAGWVDKLVLFGIKKADYVITASYEYFEQYKHTGRVFLTPPLLNVSDHDLTAFTDNKHTRYITYCGELRHAKGVVDLMHAFAKLVHEKRVHNCKLRYIGSGQAAGELVALASQNGISGQVLFCGQIGSKEALKKALSQSLIFVLPSYSEGFPRVAYECFTLGVPAILTPVGGIPFLVQHQTHCLLVPPGDANALAAAIETLVADAPLQRRLATNAQQLMVDAVFPRIKAEGSLAQMVLSKIEKGVAV